MTPEQIEAKRQHWRAWYYRTHPKTTHVCENPECGKTFEGRKNRKFCSERCGRICWDKYRRGNVQLALPGSGVAAETVKPHKVTVASAARELRVIRNLEGLSDYERERNHGRLCNCNDCRASRQAARLQAARETLAGINLAALMAEEVTG